MTDKEKLDAVRAEIHRLVDVRGYDKEIVNDLLTFMDSLPNEPETDFTKALAECIMQAQGSVVDPMVHAEIWEDELIKLAKSKEPVSEDLEEASITAAFEDMQGRQIMEESNENRQLYSRIFRRDFEAGAKWDERQKAKDAIDGEICEVEVDTCGCGLNSHTRLSIVVDDEDLRNMGHKDGDKCKVIILKDSPEYIEGVKNSYTTTTK